MKSFFACGLAWLVLVHAALFAIFWLSSGSFRVDTNTYLAKALHAPGDYVGGCLLAALGLALWAGLRLARRAGSRLAGLGSWLFGGLGLAFLAFFYGSFWLLLRESPVQLPRVLQLLGYFRLLPDLVLVAAAAWLGRGWVRRRRAAGQRRVVLPLVCFSLLWALPLALPPGSVYSGSLPARPLLIAHRGESSLAPENTLASARLAAGLGVYGLETDLHISQDGAPFLMHDDSLARTTDVKAVFPGREQQRAESFSLAEVRRLDAGSWFVQADPFGSIASGALAAAQAEAYRREPVPSLAEELAIVRERGLVFIFDLKEPPAGHPYAQTFFELVLDQLKAAQVDRQIWFLADRAELAVLRQSAPAMLPAYGGDYRRPSAADELAQAGYRVVNLEYGLPAEWIRRYQAAGLWVNLYTIDEPWQYSRLWLLGANSTTTSRPSAMQALPAPLLSLPYGLYAALWAAAGLAGWLLILR